MAIRDTIPRKFTYQDYLLFPEDGLRHELIDGEHFMAAALPGSISARSCV